MDNNEQKQETPLKMLDDLYWFMYIAYINDQITLDEWDLVKEHINGLRDTDSNIKK